MDSEKNKWLVKVVRFNHPTILRACDEKSEAEATAAALNDAYQTNEYFVELYDSDRNRLS